MKKFREQFFASPVALSSVLVLGLLYLGMIFAEFIAPYGSSDTFADHVYHPPNLRIYSPQLGLRLQVQKTTLVRVLDVQYARLKDQYVPVKFFARGQPYRLLGFIRLQRHLFGTEDPYHLEGSSLTYPVFVFGSDALGRDLFSRIWYGSRISLSIGFIGIIISMVLALFFGGIAGYYGGFIDWVVMRSAELIILIPSLYLILFLRSFLSDDFTPGQTFLLITVILSFAGWPGSARLVRGMVHSLKNEPFVMNAQLEMLPTHRILIRYIFPHLSSILIVSFALGIPGFILGETVLSYLGLGVVDPSVSWGLLLNRDAISLSNLRNFPWLLFPGLFLLLVTLAFTFLGEFFRDYFDPYHYKRS